MGISGNLVYQKLKHQGTPDIGPATGHKLKATHVHTSVTIRKSDVLEDEYFVKFYICLVGIKSKYVLSGPTSETPR